jgi:hypothetical protein
LTLKAGRGRSGWVGGPIQRLPRITHLCAIKRRRATPVAESVECRRARPDAAKETQLGSLTVPSVGDSNDLHRTTGSPLVR